jgi:hypothetical protein
MAKGCCLAAARPLAQEAFQTLSLTQEKKSPKRSHEMKTQWVFIMAASALQRVRDQGHREGGFADRVDEIASLDRRGLHDGAHLAIVPGLVSEHASILPEEAVRTGVVSVRKQR